MRSPHGLRTEGVVRASFSGTGQVWPLCNPEKSMPGAGGKLWMEDSACNKLAELALNDVQACSYPSASSDLVAWQVQLCTSCLPDMSAPCMFRLRVMC